MASRFSSSTADLDLADILGPVRRSLWLALGLAALIHAALASLDLLETRARRATRPPTTRFIKRAPRLTKPLELRKVPQPKRHLHRREVTLAAARMDQVQATANFSTHNLIASLGGTSRLHGGRAPAESASVAAVTAFAPVDIDLGIRRVAEDRIDMRLEMLDIHSMDTGRYRAMVIQDPNDKQNLKGFLKLARVVSAGYIVNSSYGAVATGGLNIVEIDIIRDMVNEWTGLQVDFAGSLTFDDTRLLEIPIILPQGRPSEVEMQNLSRYLLAGGFVLAEGLTRDERLRGMGPFDGFWREALEKYAGLTQGRDFYTERLPHDHPLFHAFFDLDGGAPLGGTSYQGASYKLVVEGFFVKGRLAAILRPWGQSGIYGHSKGRDSTRLLQFTTNTLVYALTQEGSITQRLMQMVH